jgi:hypothetical protein
MQRFTLPRDLYHGKGALEALKSLKGKKAIVCVGGGSMKRFGFLDKAVGYLKDAGMEVQVLDGIESDPSVETVLKGAKTMMDFGPDWIVAIGGGSPIDAAKAMWIKYEYPDITFEEMCKVFGIPELRKKAHFCAISSTSGTATEVTAFSIITDYQKGIKYPIADFEITPDVAIVDPELAETMPQKLVAHTVQSTTYSERQIRTVARILFEHCVTVAEKNAPLYDKTVRLFAPYVYVGGEDDDEHPFRAALVGDDEYLRTLQNTVVERDGKCFLYNTRLGYQIEKKGGDDFGRE